MKLPEPPRFTKWDVFPVSGNGIGTLTHVALQLVDVDSGMHIDFTPIRHVLVDVNNLEDALVKDAKYIISEYEHTRKIFDIIDNMV